VTVGPVERFLRKSPVQDLLEESGMEKIEVLKADLLTKLQANREDHRAIFEEALAGFQTEAEQELQSQIDLLRAGKRRDIRIVKPVPRDHTSDYDRAIAMIEMALGETIVLREEDFAQYVMDDWGWQGQFLSNVYGSSIANRKFANSQYEVH
jgi:hypothetical protein